MSFPTRINHKGFGAVLLLAGIVLGQPRLNSPEANSTSMTLIKGGLYVPFAKEDGHTVKVRIKSFYTDLHLVTNFEYLEFVKSNPEWRRSHVKPIFADGNYLRNWSGDLALGMDAPPNDPVVYVSWYAARAYCVWRGKRLPSIDEWDYAAGRMTRHESDERLLNRDLNRWYGAKARKEHRLAQRTGGGSGLVTPAGKYWEWVEDFGSLLLGGVSDGSSDLFSCGGASAGFSDPTNYSAFLRYAFLSGLKPNYCLPNLSFRPVMDLNRNTKKRK